MIFSGSSEEEAERRIQIAMDTGARILDFKGLSLRSIPESVGSLTHLEQFNVSLNKLAFLPDYIGGLLQLKYLNVSFNNLTTLPGSLGKLRGLRLLDISNNQLTTLPSSLVNLVSLCELFASGNRLNNIPEFIEELHSLSVVDFSGNLLTSLPRTIKSLSGLEALFLHDNTELALPPEILGPSRGEAWNTGIACAKASSILNYYFANEQSQPLNEAKVILVGKALAGKTSIVNRLVKDKFYPEQTKTAGIAITPWKIRTGSNEVRLNIWDFGGQEIMHATHQFFLSKRSLYLIVLNALECDPEANLDYWLRLIQCFGADSPVIIVTNKVDQHNSDLNERVLKKEYPSICGFVRTDCETATGIAELRIQIEKAIAGMSHVHEAFPASWFSLKNRLANLHENFIEYDEYEKLCRENGVKEEQNQATLISVLHDLGIIVSFSDHPRLRDTHVLNPNWVTTGIYRIINDLVICRRNNGDVTLNDLSRILDPVKYPIDKQQYLLDLMARFELCYEYYDQPNRYLIPELLPKEEPELLGFDDRNELRFEYRYEVLPEGILPRFIVRSQAVNHGLPRWRSGAVLNFERNQALVKGNVSKRRVRIMVTGEQSGRRRLLSVIRSDFDKIHASISNLTVEEFIYIPGYDSLVIQYAKLCAFEKKGVPVYTDVYNDEIISFNISKQLDGIDERGARKLSIINEHMEVDQRPVSVAISYSRKDKRLLGELLTHMKLLERRRIVSVWLDVQMSAGTRWENVLLNEFQKCEMILLLVSANYLSSDYIFDKELPIALEREKEKNVVVIPIILESCQWSHFVGHLNALPADGKPVSSVSDKSEAWTLVADAIEHAALTIQKQRSKLIN